MHLFNTVGKVSSVEIKRGPNGESLLHAFIKFESEISAQLAIQGIHGMKFMGRSIVYVLFMHLIFKMYFHYNFLFYF